MARLDPTTKLILDSKLRVRLLGVKQRRCCGAER